MKTPLKVKFEKAAAGLRKDLEATKTNNYNKETKLKRVFEIAGHALMIRQLINEEPLLNQVYEQLQAINEECNKLFSQYV